MTIALNPVQKCMLRLVLFGAGKTILHKGTICEVVETHNQIRRLLPLIDEDGEAKAIPFWVPRNAAIRKEMKDERIRRRYVRSTRVAFSCPHYKGDSRPATHPDDGILLVPVTLKSLIPTPNNSGVLASTWGNRVPSRLLMSWRGFHFVESVPISVKGPKKTRTFFSRASVERGLKKMRIDSVKKAALMEVVFYRQSPLEVARTYAFPLPNLEVYASRLRKRIRSEDPEAFTK